jgi:nucleoside permease NupC
MDFLGILLCVAYAVLYGLLGLLFLAALAWLLSLVGMQITPEIRQILRAIIIVLVFIALLICLFGGGDRMDLFHLHHYARVQ